MIAKNQRWFFVVTVVMFGIIGPFRQSSAEEFYKDKSIGFMVGYSAGGGYDTFTRAISRHMGQFIPGKPTLIVYNRTGAGSLIAANYVYGRAKADGLTVGVFGSGLITQQALGAKGIRFDGRKFGWLGSVSPGTPVCAIMGFTGLKTLDDVIASKKRLKFGSTGAGSTTDDLPRLLNGLMGANTDIIAGYGGTANLRVAMARKELDGACWTWESMRATARAMLEAKGDEQLIPFVIEGKYEDPEVKNTPQFSDRVKGEDNIRAWKAWINPYKFFRPMVVPPGTPPDRLQTLRVALKKTMEDPAFLAEAKKSKLDVAYTSAEEVERLMQEVLDISPTAKAKLKQLFAAN